MIDLLNAVNAYTNSGTIQLAANVLYPFVIEWQHGTGADYQCTLLWTPPGQTAPSVIPVQNLEMAGTWWNGNSSSWYPNTWY